MKRLLQRIEDGLYYQGRGTWTNNPDLAHEFHKTSGAIECCLREELPPVQLVLKFEDSAFDIRLPFGPMSRGQGLNRKGVRESSHKSR